MTRANDRGTDVREAVIVSAVRTAIGLARTGSLADTRSEDLGRVVLRTAVQQIAGLASSQIDDVVMGCAMQEGEQGRNIARAMALYAGFPAAVPGLTVNRSCASGLQAIAYAADRIRLGDADIIAAGGVESGSRVPLAELAAKGHPLLADRLPELYAGLGHHAEETARREGITRQMQDAYAAMSHQKAVSAIEQGKFQEEIVPLKVNRQGTDHHGQPWGRSYVFSQDEGVHADATPELLSLLKPSYVREGTVTTANEAPLADGAAALLIMSRACAEQLGAVPLATIRSFSVRAQGPELPGHAACDSALAAVRRAGLALSDIALVELDEAHAATAIPVIRSLGVDPKRVNVNGGSLALGRPLGAAGARLVVTLVHELRRRGSGYGLATLGASGGIGASCVIEVHPRR